MYDKEKFLKEQKNRLAKTVFDKMENKEPTRKLQVVTSFPAIKDWTNETLDKFLYTQKFTSLNSLHTYLHFVREVHKFVCQEEQVGYESLRPTKEDIEYIDWKKLRSKTILTPEEFKGLRNELVYLNEDGIEGNIRDVVIFELGFMGLTVKEISELENDTEHIEFFEEDGLEKIRLHLVTGRTVIIDNKQIISDIKAAQEEQYYFKMRGLRNGNITEDSLEFVWSKYLIRGIANGISVPGKPVDNVSAILQRRFKSISHPILDLEHFNLSDLRRSAIIQLILAHPYLTAVDLSLYLDKEYSSDLSWLRVAATKLSQLEKAKK